MRTVTLDDLCDPAPPYSAADWNDDGVLILPRFLPEQLMADYEQEWLDAHAVADRRTGWAHATPYMENPALRRLCCYQPLVDTIHRLIDEAPGLHLCLTGWISTRRDWHQDTYLNPPHVGDFYAAVWFALGDIDPDSGPFQYVPGSHRWPYVTQEKIGRLLDVGAHDWPTRSEEILTPLFEAEIETRDAEIIDHLPERGDVLIWHGRLLHRGSTPNRPDLERRALIAHYSGVKHRPDMPPPIPERDDDHEVAGLYFPLGPQPAIYRDT